MPVTREETPTDTEDIDLFPLHKANTALELVDQMRQEEDAALQTPLARQTREEAADYASWVAAGRRPGDVTPILPLKYGQRAPTSQGYMYIGAGVPGTEAPPAFQLNRALARSDVPAANEAMQRMVTEPGRSEIIGIQQNVPQPVPTGDEMRFQAMQNYQRDIASGTPQDVAFQRWGPMLLGSTSRPGYRGFPQQRSQYQTKDVRGRLLRTNVMTGETQDVTPPTVPTGSMAAVTAPKATPAENAEHRAVLSRMAKVQGELDKEIATYGKKPGWPTENAKRLVDEWMSLRDKQTALGSKYAGGGGRTLDVNTARQFLQQARGNKDEARRLAKAAGYSI